LLHQRFGGTWAKVEIFLGLFAAGLGLLLGNWSLTRQDIEWGLAAAGMLLFVLGGYLTLAGQRSHLYRSNIESTNRLNEAIQRRKVEG
jgi:hypothetical protein